MTFSQTVSALVAKLTTEQHLFTRSQISLAARNYLIATGTRKPSRAMVEQLAEAVYQELP